MEEFYPHALTDPDVTQAQIIDRLPFSLMPKT